MNEADKIIEDQYLIRRITISKKYSFSLLALIAVIGVLFIVKGLQFSDKVSVITIVSTQISLLVITVAYVTGQAKIDLQASATYGKRQTQVSPPFSISMPPTSPPAGGSEQAASIIQGLSDLIKPKG
jgi:ACR3 family arsenite efflux pump ArsB